MFWKTDGLSPYSHLSQVHRGYREGEENDSDRRGWMLSCLPGQINSSNYILVAANEKLKKPTATLCLSRSCTFFGAQMNKLSYFTLTTVKAGREGVCDRERYACQLPHLSDQSTNYPLTICVLLLVSQVYPLLSALAWAKSEPGIDG